MKKFVLFSAVFFLSFLIYNCSDKSKPELTENVKSGLRLDAKQFSESLKSILLKEIQTNGLPAAVSVCSDTAQILTNNFGITKGIYIKRVSFNNRNPNDYPDEFETKALNHFAKLKSKGQLNDSTEFVEVMESDGIKTVRYLKPILIQAPCLNCHGQRENIMPEVKAIIDQKYPSDKATGYSLNDLRGAVSIKKVL